MIVLTERILYFLYGYFFVFLEHIIVNQLFYLRRYSESVYRDIVDFVEYSKTLVQKRLLRQYFLARKI